MGGAPCVSLSNRRAKRAGQTKSQVAVKTVKRRGEGG